MKLLSLVCIFTVIACQPALAQGYTYESAGYNAPEYVNVDGVRYTRIPTKNKQVSPSPAWQLKADTQSESDFKRNVINTEWLSLHPYLGIEGALGRNKYKTYLDDSLFKKNLKRLGVFAGLQFNQYIGLEVFYNSGKIDDNTVDASVEYADASILNSLDFNAYGADLFGYIPIAKKIDIILGLGYGWYTYDAKAKVSVYIPVLEEHYYTVLSDKLKTEAVRFSLGTQLLLTPHWALRVMGRYVDFTDDDAIKNIMEISVGLRYLF